MPDPSHIAVITIITVITCNKGHEAVTIKRIVTRFLPNTALNPTYNCTFDISYFSQKNFEDKIFKILVVQ